MESSTTTRREPIGRGNRLVILGFTAVISSLGFGSLVLALGLPGLAGLGPVFATFKIVNWLLSDRPAVPARTWIPQALAGFVLWPVFITLFHKVWP